MNPKALLQVCAAVAALLLAGLVGYTVGTRDPHQPVQTAAAPDTKSHMASEAATATEKRKVLYWYDPMYPQHKFDQPGKSPFMDMQLVPKYADEQGTGAVKIDAALAQNLGMRTASVERATVSMGINAVGSVGFNEREIAIVQARTGGFVERVYARAPGDVIQGGAPLADVLMSEWAGAQEEYLAVKATGDVELTAAARERLLLLGMSDAQIRRIEQTGQPRAIMTIYAPIGGVIQELGVRAGMSVSPGMTLARINGLRSVWLEAAVPEVQASLLQPGRAVQARFTAYPGKVFAGKIAAVLPEANRETRTLRVRMEFPNPRQQLKAGMFAQVQITGDTEEALVVPSQAVIRTGKRSMVFVSERPGQFRPVEIEVGHEADGKIAVLKGLEPGQQVAVSGQFLIDSEASLQGLTDRMAAAPDGKAGAAPSEAALVHHGSGTITKLAPGEVTLSHGPIASMQCPPMTMPFELANEAVARGLKPGDSVHFSFRQEADHFVIDRIEKSGGGK
jgi:Cu(I)/Ag(I) efflux system membrane fusion protein